MPTVLTGSRPVKIMGLVHTVMLHCPYNVLVIVLSVLVIVLSVLVSLR